MAVTSREHSEPTTTVGSGPTKAATASDGSAYATPEASAIMPTPRRRAARPSFAEASFAGSAAIMTMMKGTMTKKGAICSISVNAS